MSSRGSIARKDKYDLVIQYPSTATKRVFLWICRNRQHHMLRAHWLLRRAVGIYRIGR